jgi:hypothetical protein
MWHILGGYRLWYDERLTFKHYMPCSRLTKEYWTRLRQDCSGHEDVIDKYRLVLKAINRRRKLPNITRFITGAMRALTGSKRGQAIAQAYCPVPGIIFDRSVEQILRFVANFRRQQSMAHATAVSAEFAQLESPQPPAAPKVVDVGRCELQAA